MRSSIAASMGRSLYDLAASSRAEWIARWPAMVVLAVNDIGWTKYVERAIRSMSFNREGKQTCCERVCACARLMLLRVAQELLQPRPRRCCSCLAAGSLK